VFYHVKYHCHGFWEFGYGYLEWGDIIKSITCPERWVDMSQLEKREKNMPGKGSQILSPLIKPDRNVGQIIMWLILPRSASSVQLPSRVWLLVTPWTTVRQASLSITNSRSLLKLMSIESMMPSNHLILCHPLLFLPSIFPSIRGFSNESVLWIRWPKYWSFSFSISPSNEYSGLISFRKDWLDLLAVQGTLKSLLYHHSSKASILRHSAFFIVQLSHPYMSTGKTIALTRWTFVGKVMFLLLNMLSRFVITFLPESKCLLISWLQSPSAIILESQKIKSVTVSTVSPSICHEVMGPDAMVLIFLMLNFKPTFSFSLSLSSRGSLVLLCFLP